MPKLFIVFIITSLSMASVYGQNDFRFRNKNVKPGSKTHFKVPITDGQHTTFIPVTVFRGAQNGPVLGITAGVHGYEYPPIMAGQQLIETIDLQKLKGTVILVQLANVAGFLGRSPFLNPLDGKNLNRSFPGNPQGSITERIAAFISNEVIGRSDFFLDMHAGDAPEDLMSYSAYYSHQQKPTISEKGKKMAIALGFDHVIVFDATSKKYMKADKPSLYCSAEAFKRGIPSIDIECGKLGQSSQFLARKIVTGVMQLLGHLEMYQGQVSLPKTTLFIKQRVYQSSEFEGIFYPNKSAGDYVSQGMKIGHITDFFGKQLITVYAKESGVILIILGTPPVNKGETVVVIGKVNE